MNQRGRTHVDARNVKRVTLLEHHTSLAVADVAFLPSSKFDRDSGKIYLPVPALSFDLTTPTCRLSVGIATLPSGVYPYLLLYCLYTQQLTHDTDTILFVVSGVVTFRPRFTKRFIIFISSYRVTLDCIFRYSVSSHTKVSIQQPEIK